MTGQSVLVRRVPTVASVSGPLRSSGRLRELLFVGFGSLAVAALMTWPVLRHPTRTVPQDLNDPLYFVWQIAWTGHALVTHPGSMYTTNAFTAAPGNLAYTDSMIGYAPFASLVNGLVPGIRGALLTYNLLYVLAAALAFAAAYLLASVLGARVPGALVAAAGYGFAPWHLAHARHLNVISTGGIVLALAMIAYGHGWSFGPADQRPALVRRPGWIVAGWLVACWQLSLGFALGVPFTWTLMLVMAIALLTWLRRGRPAVPRRVLLASGFGAAAFGLAGVLLALPFQHVVHQFPVARRTEHMVHQYSPPLHGLLTAPPESWWWGPAQSGWRDGMNAIPEQTLLPGLVLIVLALVGLGYSAWTLRHRALLAAAVLLSGVLAAGTSGPDGGRWTYLLIFHNLPGFQAVRTPGRLILWCTLALALLAAGAVTKAADRAAIRRRARAVGIRRPGWPRPVAMLLLVPALLVLAEGIGPVKQQTVPRVPVALHSLPGLVLVLPTSQVRDYLVMTWSTDGWPELVNGGSGFEPPDQSKLRRTAQAFPDGSMPTPSRA